MGIFDLFKKSKKVDDDYYYESVEDYMDDFDYEERLSVSDAADIWRSSGMDEDYMFGYTAEELENEWE